MKLIYGQRDCPLHELKIFESYASVQRGGISSKYVIIYLSQQSKLFHIQNVSCTLLRLCAVRGLFSDEMSTSTHFSSHSSSPLLHYNRRTFLYDDDIDCHIPGVPLVSHTSDISTLGLYYGSTTNPPKPRPIIDQTFLQFALGFVQFFSDLQDIESLYDLFLILLTMRDDRWERVSKTSI